MSNTARWKALKKELEAKSSHDFERTLYPLLRIRWPDLVHPKSLKYLDNSGIDQVLVADGSPLGVVIQCKGFEVQEPLGSSQIAQIAKSLKKFVSSGFKATQYVLLYNRFGEDQNFENSIRELLAQSVATGAIEIGLLWNLNNLADELSQDLLAYMMRELNEKAHKKQARDRARFRFGNSTVKSVPFSIGKMSLSSNSKPDIENQTKIELADPIDYLPLNQQSISLLVGHFGAGKSTLSHRLAEIQSHRLVYVPAAALTHTEVGNSSENSLAQGIIEYLEIFDDEVNLTPEQRIELSYLAGPLLSAKFRTPHSGLILLIDAIDENRYYASMKGFQVLTNELARTQCPVIITTRLEHFIDSFETYADSLGERSKFGVKDIKVLTLKNWLPVQAQEYIRAAANHAELEGDTEAMSRLERLLCQVDFNTIESTAFRHPLFLAMTTQLVAAGDEKLYARKSDLYEHWSREKLLRDFREERYIPPGFENPRLLVTTLLLLMNAVAGTMIEHTDNGIELAEYIDENIVREIAQKLFFVPVATDLYTVTAFLEPQRIQKSGNLRLRFFHKSFQEFFTARHIKQQGIEANYFPLTVREFL